MLFETICPLVVATQSPRRRKFLMDLGLKFSFLEEALGISFLHNRSSVNQSSVGVLAKDDVEDRPKKLELPEVYVHRMCLKKAWDAAMQLGFVLSKKVPDGCIDTCIDMCIKDVSTTQVEKPFLSYPIQCQSIDTECLQKVSQSAILTADTVVALGNEILGKPKDSEDAFCMLKRLVGRKHKVLTGVSLLDMRNGAISSFIDTTLVHFAPWSDELLHAYVATGDSLDKAGAYGIQGIGAFLSDHIEGSWDTVAGLPVAKTIELLQRTNIIKAVS